MFFQRLEDLRINADKTQEEISSILNCKREVYRRYEKGIYEIPVWALIKLAEYYHTSTDYILGLTNIREPYLPISEKEMFCIKALSLLPFAAKIGRQSQDWIFKKRRNGLP